jgi:hypothetical protein
MAKITPPRNYLSKDFNDFRSELLRYARTFFPDKIQDFSEASVGGLFLDMASAIGDNLSFYLDHQFNELSWSNAIEVSNIQRHLENNGVKIVGDSPSLVDLTFFLEVPATTTNGERVPDERFLPAILKNTKLRASNGVNFSTIEDLDFSETDRLGNLLARVQVSNIDNSGFPSSFILSAKVGAVSGEVVVEQFSFDSNFVPFRTVSLSSPNVTEVLSAVDSEGNRWYEVDSLTQDTVFVGVKNLNDDRDLVNSNIQIVSSPRRFQVVTDLSSRNTELRFGGGEPNVTDENEFPDPSNLALPLFGRETIPRFTLDPNSLLRSRTLGISPVSTALAVTYRAGGGLSHNVSPGSIRSIEELLIEFRKSPSSPIATLVRSSIDVINEQASSGGDSAPTIEQLRVQIPAARNSQQRIVTKNDLLARVYSLPAKFGRVFRVGVRQSSQNPLSTLMYVVSKDENGKLVTSPDLLKQNIKNYLNEFRLISDAIDVLDARIINYVVQITIVPDENTNNNDLIRQVISTIRNQLRTDKFQIDQPIQISSIFSEAIKVPGVLSITEINIQGISGEFDNRPYSDVFFDASSNTSRGMIIGPPGSIFELKYPETDIIVTTV